MVETETESPVRINTDLLGKRVLLLSPTMSIWRGQVQLPKKAEVHMDYRILDPEAVTTPRVKLMTKSYPLDSDGKPWKARFDSCSSRLSALKNQFSVSFAINGVRIIPKAAANEFMQLLFGPTVGSLRRKITEAEDAGRSWDAHTLSDMIADVRANWGDYYIGDRTPVYDRTVNVQSIAYEFWDNAMEFVRDYHSVLQQIREHNSCWDIVSQKVPKSPEAMLKKFDLGVFPVELSGTTTNEVSMEDLQDHVAVVRATCERQVQLAIESMIAEPRKELAETIQNIETLIANQGRITARTFDRVRRAMEKLSNFSFVSNTDLLDRMNRLNAMLNTTPSQLNTADMVTAVSTVNFANELASIRQTLEDRDIMESDLVAFGGSSRALKFDDDDD